jgi:hypothetical protein
MMRFNIMHHHDPVALQQLQSYYDAAIEDTRVTAHGAGTTPRNTNVTAVSLLVSAYAAAPSKGATILSVTRTNADGACVGLLSSGFRVARPTEFATLPPYKAVHEEAFVHCPSNTASRG